MNNLLRLALLCLTLGIALAGCGPVMQTQYSFTPPKSTQGKMMVTQCQQIQTLCRQNCRLEKQSCVSDARSRGMMEYQRYVAERNAKKEPLKRSPESFVSDWQCNDSRCEASCGEDFRLCYANAGGAVHAKTVCTAFCE